MDGIQDGPVTDTNADVVDDLTNYGDHLPVLIMKDDKAYGVGTIDTRHFGGSVYLVIEVGERVNP